MFAGQIVFIVRYSSANWQVIETRFVERKLLAGVNPVMVTQRDGMTPTGKRWAKLESTPNRVFDNRADAVEACKAIYQGLINKLINTRDGVK